MIKVGDRLIVYWRWWEWFDCEGVGLCVKVEAEIRREVVLSRLLTMVELPILDGILSYEGTANQKSSRKQPLAFSNLAFKRQESICSIFEERLVYV